MWDGRRLGLEGAKKMGFDRVKLRSNFIKDPIQIQSFSNILNMDVRDDVRDFKNDKYDLYDIQNKFLEIIADKEKGKISEDAIKLIARTSEGSVRDSISLLDRSLISQNINENKQIEEPDVSEMLGLADKSKVIALFKEVLSGNQAILEFETTIEGKYINGVDIITFNDEGKISEFKVMIRPLQAVNMIHMQMQRMLEELA